MAHDSDVASKYLGLNSCHRALALGREGDGQPQSLNVAATNAMQDYDIWNNSNRATARSPSERANIAQTMAVPLGIHAILTKEVPSKR